MAHARRREGMVKRDMNSRRRHFPTLPGLPETVARLGCCLLLPITLSLSNLAGETISTSVAARGITLAALANTAVKMLITCTGAPALMKYSVPIFSIMIITGLVVSFTLI